MYTCIPSIATMLVKQYNPPSQILQFFLGGINPNHQFIWVNNIALRTLQSFLQMFPTNHHMGHCTVIIGFPT